MSWSDQDTARLQRGWEELVGWLAAQADFEKADLDARVVIPAYGRHCTWLTIDDGTAHFDSTVLHTQVIEVPRCIVPVDTATDDPDKDLVGFACETLLVKVKGIIEPFLARVSGTVKLVSFGGLLSKEWTDDTGYRHVLIRAELGAVATREAAEAPV